MKITPLINEKKYNIYIHTYMYTNFIKKYPSHQTEKEEKKRKKERKKRKWRKKENNMK